MKNTVIKNRIIKTEDFLNKRFKPSIQTKYHFIRLFEVIYSNFSENIDIKSLEWDRNEFLIMFLDKKSGEILHLSLKDNYGNKKCSGILCTNNLCTSIHNEISNESFLKFLVYFIVKGTDFTLDTFLKIMTKDLKAKKEYYQIFWKQNRPPFSIIQDWGHPLQKYRFIVHEGIMRNMDQSINLNLPEASIHHSERECQGISPNNKETGYHFFNFPTGYYDHRFDKYYYLTNEEKKQYIYGKNEGQNMGITTDLNENDIVMGGGTDKLSYALDYVVEKIEENNIKLLRFNCCCVPRIIGDDIYSVLQRTKEKIKIPFIFQGQLEKTPYEQKIMLLEKFIKELNISKIKKVKNSISLFGYHENIFQKELGDILLENGIKINTSFIPSIDIRLLELMYKSELFVFSPNNFQKEVFEYPFQEIGTKFINPKYPYGLEESDNWLNTILENFALDIKINNKTSKIKSEYIKKVDTVKTRGYKVGIVCLGLQEVTKFLSADYMNNIDIAGFLEEMGFKLEFFVLDDFEGFINKNDDSFKILDGNHKDIEKIIFDKVKDLTNINIHYFSSEDNLISLIKSKNLNLIYSDLYFDNRIIDMGLNQFSLKNFYVGYSGALKTIDELINLCELSFYKNYSKYFSN